MTGNHKRSYLVAPWFLFILVMVAPGAPLLAQTNATFNDPVRFVQAGDDLQAALNQAKPGDTILLEPGATFTGNFVLPVKASGNNSITLRSAATDAQLLESGTRITPGFAQLLPKLVSPNSEAALRAAPGAHHFRIIGLELTIATDVNLNYGIVKLGEGNETALELLPHDLLLDRCYIHGQPLADVARGVALNSAATTILNSYIADCHGLGFDTQAIASWNGAGPFQIINNYLEGAGENVLFGGADPKIANLVPADIEFRRNLVAKPLAWKDGILAKPANLTGAGMAASGLLAGGTTYYYRVAARARAGQSVMATSAASDELSITLQPGENLVQLNWDRVQLATVYRIYRTTDEPSAPERKWIAYEMDASPCASTETLCPFTDTGSEASVTGSAPLAVGTRWSVKNLFELKNARRVLADGNLFENNWVDAQSGIAILFTVRNQDGRAPWSVVEDVKFTNNIVRHTSGAINILGQDNLHPSQKAQNIKIMNNLFEDISGKVWGGNGVFLTITDVASLTVMHNTILQSGNIVIAYGEPSSGVKFMNNILQHNEYGIIGDGTGTGKSTLDRYLPGKKFKGNAFIGGQPSLYPQPNFFFPAVVDIGFADPANGNYELVPSSPLKGQGTDGADVGCDMNALQAAFNF